MSIFVNKNHLFDIEFTGEYVNDNLGVAIGFKECQEGKVKVVLKCLGRDFESMSQIIEEASIINAVTGKPLLRSGVFCQLIILHFVRNIQVITEYGEESFVISKELINKLQYDLVKSIAMKWLAFTDGRK